MTPTRYFPISGTARWTRLRISVILVLPLATACGAGDAVGRQLLERELQGTWNRRAPDATAPLGWSEERLTLRAGGEYSLARITPTRIVHCGYPTCVFQAPRQLGDWNPSEGVRYTDSVAVGGVWQVRDLSDGRSLCLMRYNSAQVQCDRVDLIRMRDPAPDPPIIVEQLSADPVAWSRVTAVQQR